MRFEVLRAVNVEITVFCNLMLCSLVEVYHNFSWIYSLSLHGRRFSWRWSSMFLWNFIKPLWDYMVSHQKPVIFRSNLTQTVHFSNIGAGKITFWFSRHFRFTILIPIILLLLWDHGDFSKTNSLVTSAFIHPEWYSVCIQNFTIPNMMYWLILDSQALELQGWQWKH